MSSPTLSHAQENEVVETSSRYLDLAADAFRRNIEMIPIHFDLTGRCAGMFKMKGGQRMIRYNPYIFARYYQDSLENTVPHEVAHYVVEQVYGRTNIRPHGRQWKNVMALFGCSPKVTGHYDLTGIPARQYQRFPYICECQSHQLTIIRHKRVLKGQARYLCRRCGTALRPDQSC